MKKTLLSFALISLVVSSGAQTISTELVTDNPNIDNWLSVNVDLFDMEIPGSSLDAAIENLSFNAGVWGHVEVPKLPIGLQYSYRQSWFVLGAIGNKNMPKHKELQLGASFFLKDNTKSKSLKVGLKSSSSETKTTRTTTQTYINKNGKQRNQLGLRAGLLYKASGLTIDTENPTPSNIETIEYKSTGLYAGILNRKTTNLVLNTDRFGLVSTASKASNIYLDAIIGFSNTFVDIDNANADVSDEIKTHLDGFPIGARLGFQVYQVEKRDITGKMFGLSARGEAGYRPYYGPYLSASVGLTIIKAQK